MSDRPESSLALLDSREAFNGSPVIEPAEVANNEYVPAHARILMLTVVIVPFLGFVGAVFLLWGYGFSWAQLAIFLSMYLLTSLGITVGYHRLFTHRSFETVWPVKLGLAVLGSMAVEGPVLKWAAVHRRHHQHSDKHDDPHSPHRYGGGAWGILRGFCHAHVGWMFAKDVGGLPRYVGDLMADRPLRATSRLFVVWAIAGLVIPAAAGALLTWSWFGALMGLLWGGLARVFLVHHMTFSINSICHMWGGRPFRSHDQSRNNLVFGFVGLGEGWHNNHHAFPTSAKHGLMWWQLDATYLVIWGLQKLRLAWKVRLPDQETLAAKLSV